MPIKSESGTPRPDESRFFETYDFKGEISSQMIAQYPLVTGKNETFSAYMRGDHHFCSISTTADLSIRTKVLIEGLHRAQNENTVEYSPHGAEHRTYIEVLQTMMAFLQDGQASIVTGEKIIPVDRNLTMRRVETFVLSAPAYERRAFIPLPLKEAIEIQADPQALIKIARRYALDPQYGYAFSLLFLTFKGAPTELLKRALSDKQWLHNQEKKIAGRVLRDGQNDYGMITDFLHRTLMIPDPGGIVHATTDPVQYKKTVDYLRAYKFDVQGHDQALGFADIVTHPRPRVVMTSATEIAEKTANSKFLEPIRHTWIFDQYGKVMTTRVKTAYLVFE